MSTLVAMIVLLLLMVAVIVASSPAPPVPASGTEVAGQRRPPSLVLFRPARPTSQQNSGRQQPSFHGRAAGGCMPRGFRVPPSAPSRYVNYHTLDAGVCGHGGGGRKSSLPQMRSSPCA
ncbi:hypothetical protein PVAP13_7KG027229 [Panicum virgatum]|uniref:Secreted protein n=1 Tax=Panicum virgatum TaxID=38727 RepID=A0A8T0QDP7_PANVG|nr:hypothetical protein PVAP13_7KG027229 [Panicum virgatum]